MVRGWGCGWVGDMPVHRVELNHQHCKSLSQWLDERQKAEEREEVGPPPFRFQVGLRLGLGLGLGLGVSVSGWFAE